ncbi:MAG: glycosyltransferase [Vicinamibacteria bacterium]|nr:glycosyltransferase [Vicinamibacteria bacterium]
MTAENAGPNASFDVVYFASVDWRHTWQRSQHLASRLARCGRVLYLDPPGLRAPRRSDIFRLFARSGRQESRPVPNLDVSRTLPCWLSVRYSLIARLNAWRTRRIVRNWMRRGSGRPPLLWASRPSPIVLEATCGLPRTGFVYDAVDRFAAFHPKNARFITDTERSIVRSADVVLAVSENLHRDLSSVNPHAYLVPNAVDFAHFSRDKKHEPPPAELARLPRPIAGYVGEIASWLDLSIIERLSRSGVCASIVLIGPAESDQIRRLRKLPNTHWLGRQRYSDLPRYVRNFDVGLIPFQITPLTLASSPIKLFEYLAAGCPVVSTPLPAVEAYGSVTHIADSVGFVAGVADALKTAQDASLRRRRVDMARANDWRFRVERIIDILHQHGMA